MTDAILCTLTVMLWNIRRDSRREMYCHSRSLFEGYISGLKDAGFLSEYQASRLRNLADCAQFQGHLVAFWEDKA